MYAAPLQGAALDVLCASEDCRAMCEWADARTGQRCTLIQAIAVAEHLGLKLPGVGDPPKLDRFLHAGSSGPPS